MEDIAIWTLDEIADLLANVDNLANTNHLTRLSPMLSEDVFWKSIQESLANPRPLDQIKHKVQEYGNLDQVYRHGIRYMKLDDDLKQAVEAKLVAIRVSSPRQLRSNSRKRLQSDQLSVTPTPSFPAKSVEPSARRLTGIRRDSKMAKVRVSQWSQKLLLT